MWPADRLGFETLSLEEEQLEGIGNLDANDEPLGTQNIEKKVL